VNRGRAAATTAPPRYVGTDARADREPVRRAYGWADPRADGRAQRRADASTERRADRAADRVSYIWPDRAALRDPVGRAFGYAYSEPDSATDAADKDESPDAAADRAAAADAGSGACPDVHNLDDDDQDADARPDVRADSYAAAAAAARGARGAATVLFLRLLRDAHDGADHGDDYEPNGDGSPDARGDVRTDARHGGAVLRADDGHLCAIGRADGHGAALAFGSADGRADDGADAADSLDGGDDDIRARRRRGTPPPHPSPAHNSTPP